MPDGVTAIHVAEMHQADLKIEHQFNCRGLTYWCDEKRKTAFCLIEAPNINAIKELHEQAHGDVPQQIIEVNDTIVESFLGRIEDPEKSQNIALNIINDPALRTVIVLKIEKTSLKESSYKQLSSILKNINTTVNTLKGRVVKQKDDYILISYKSITNALQSALEIKKIVDSIHITSIKLNIGLSTGLPITNKEGLFEQTIKTAEHLSSIAKTQIMITSEVKDLYESENLNIPINEKLIYTINYSDENFLISLMNHLDKEWHNPALNINSFCNNLGYSKSQLYRKTIALTGKSINSFVQDFRLKKALRLLHKKNKNISEIAFETGFNSAAYFSKCFQKKYDLLPSTYFKSI